MRDPQVKMEPDLQRYLRNYHNYKEIRGFEIKDVLGCGNTAITYRVQDKSGFEWAMKIVPRALYGDRAPFREVGRFASIRDRRHLALPEETGEWSLSWKSKTIEFVWLRSRMVNGQTLRDFLKECSIASVHEEVSRFITHIASALYELKRAGFAHGDLHDRNIMREILGTDGPAPEINYVVIDFSEAYDISSENGGLQADLVNLSEHLRSFCNAIMIKNDVSREDEIVLSALQHIPGLLQGPTAAQTRVKDPTDILNVYNDALRSFVEVPSKLNSPFDSLSAEDIVDEGLLTKLCETNSWWARELEVPGNVLLVGPRGCGKTMLFKRFRLKTKIAAKKFREVLEQDEYVAFYLPCESLFYNRFTSLSDLLVERYRDALLLYFNMAIMAEVASTTAALPPRIGNVTPSIVATFVRLLKEEIYEMWTAIGLPASPSSAADVARCSEKVMRHLHRAISYGENISAKGTLDFTARLVQECKRGLPRLAGKRFTFFLDDYTEERVPLSLQHVLHPILSRRSGDSCFKISAHIYGSIYSYPQPAPLDDERNVRIINIGSAYLSRSSRTRERELLLHILNKRFKESLGYKGTILDWLGLTHYPKRSLGESLHDSKTRDSVKFHGVECLTQLCSGDFSEMIRMVGEIFKKANISRDIEPFVIKPSIQDKAITYFARDSLERIRHIRPDGGKLYEITERFGNLTQNYLYLRRVKKGKTSDQKPRSEPYEMLSIYVDNLVQASDIAKKKWETLQRAAIFIDGRLAKSLRPGLADRGTLRRIYAPAFPTTLKDGENLNLDKSNFEWFMDKPKEYCDMRLARLREEAAQGKLDWESQAGISPNSISGATDIEEEKYPAVGQVLKSENRVEFDVKQPTQHAQLVISLPELKPLNEAVSSGADFDVFIGALGFEERTVKCAEDLADRSVRIRKVLLFDYDMYRDESELLRDQYGNAVARLTGGAIYRPLLASVASRQPGFSEDLRRSIRTLSGVSECPRIIFDCTSCPSLILSKSLRVLLELHCDLTIIYAEAQLYYPTKKEYEEGELKPSGGPAPAPCGGVRFTDPPAELQATDIGELPVAAVLLPTFTTERTARVLAELESAKRIWLFGEPHDPANSYRIEMAKKFASKLVEHGDPWSLVSTFDYRHIMRILAGIYATYKANHRITVVPHGSKMTTLGVALHAVVHDVSLEFAVPETYDAKRYSEGCKSLWAVNFGDTTALLEKMRKHRALPFAQVGGEIRNRHT